MICASSRDENHKGVKTQSRPSGVNISMIDDLTVYVKQQAAKMKCSAPTRIIVSLKCKKAPIRIMPNRKCKKASFRKKHKKLCRVENAKNYGPLVRKLREIKLTTTTVLV